MHDFKHPLNTRNLPHLGQAALAKTPVRVNELEERHRKAATKGDKHLALRVSNAQLVDPLRDNVSADPPPQKFAGSFRIRQINDAAKCGHHILARSRLLAAAEFAQLSDGNTADVAVHFTTQTPTSHHPMASLFKVLAEVQKRRPKAAAFSNAVEDGTHQRQPAHLHW